MEWYEVLLYVCIGGITGTVMRNFNTACTSVTKLCEKIDQHLDTEKKLVVPRKSLASFLMMMGQADEEKE